MAHSRWRAEGSGRSRRGSAPTESIPVGELAAYLVTLTDPLSAASEAYRTLRTNLIYSHLDTPPKVIVVTSPEPGEGKSTTCANLGVVLSQAGKEVLIVDCDFRGPTLHKFFGLRNLFGVVDVLAGERALQEVAGEPVPNLKILPLGPMPPDPSELLSSKRFAGFLSEVRQEYDYVLVDTSPVELFSDSAVLAAQSDGVLLVLDSQNSRKKPVRQALHNLEAVGAKVLGVVMNNAGSSQNGYYNDSYYGSK